MLPFEPFEEEYLEHWPHSHTDEEFINVMENLTPDVREVILPKDFQQLTIGEIGDEPGITVTEDKSRRHRARLITRALLLSDPPLRLYAKK